MRMYKVYVNVISFHALITSIALFVTIFKALPSICTIYLFLAYNLGIIMTTIMIFTLTLA